jgi:NHLM bacteriocin system ABC transporter peptidase/ATP-binding protein
MAESVYKRVRTPTLLQMEAVECGAAALGIILGHYGRIVQLEELRVRCGVSRDGSKASNMLKAARTYGLVAKGFSKEPEALRSLPLPLIVFWNFNHFIVVEGFGTGRVFLNDPAIGPRQVTDEEFDQSFTGVVLLFEKGKDFQPGGNKPSLLAALARRLAGSRDAVAFAFIASLFAVITGLVIPTFSRIFVDTILVGGMPGWLWPLITGMAVTAVIRMAAIWMQQQYLMRFELKLSVSSTGTFLNHILRLPMEFFFQRYGGEISARVAVNERVAELLSGSLATSILNLFLVIFYVLLMFQYDIYLTMTGVIVAVLNGAFLKLISRRRINGNRQLLLERGKLMGTAMGGLQLIENIKANGSEDDFFAKWSGQFAKVLNAEQRMGLATTYLSTVPPLLGTLNGLAVLAIGGHRVMDGHMTMGMLVAFQSLMASFMAPVTQLVSMGGSLQEAEVEMNRLDDVLRYPLDPNTVTGDQPLQTDATLPESAVKLTGSLELNGITFGYSRLQPPLIEDFSLKLEPGMRVAFVGGSGSGKSTLTKLICGLYEPWEGEVLFDGKKRSSLPREILTNSLSFVDQDIYLFEGSIRDNLTLWDEAIEAGTIIRAAKDACVHEIITSRQGGYDAEVGEAGRNFSGGQLQRLEIARALAVNPTILVLDEATSALDPVTETMVDNNIRRRGCTSIIVAHRLSAVRDCDEIIVLDAGRVVERGTHGYLMSTDGPYAELVRNM